MSQSWQIKSRRKSEKTELLEKAVPFFLEYFPGDIFKESTFEINLISGSLEDSDSRADCYFHSEDNLIEINIDLSFSKYSLVRSLAHEMVHAKQYVLKELVDIDYDRFKWKKRTYKYDEIDYWDREYEMEAYARECAMMYKFIIKHELQNEKWVKTALKYN